MASKEQLYTWVARNSDPAAKGICQEHYQVMDPIFRFVNNKALVFNSRKIAQQHLKGCRLFRDAIFITVCLEGPQAKKEATRFDKVVRDGEKIAPWGNDLERLASVLGKKTYDLVAEELVKHLWLDLNNSFVDWLGESLQNSPWQTRSGLIGESLLATLWDAVATHLRALCANDEDVAARTAKAIAAFNQAPFVAIKKLNRCYVMGFCKDSAD